MAISGLGSFSGCAIGDRCIDAWRLCGRSPCESIYSLAELFFVAGDRVIVTKMGDSLGTVVSASSRKGGTISVKVGFLHAFFSELPMLQR